MTAGPNSPTESNTTTSDNGPTSPVLPHNEEAPEAPPVPPKPTLRIHTLIGSSPNISVATRLVARQNELYCSTSMNMHADILANTPILVEERVGKIAADESFWRGVVLGYGPHYFSEHESEKIEAAIITGVPAEVRPVYYLKVMQISARMDSTMYNGILKKAKLAHWEGPQIEWDSFSENLRETLQVFHFCMLEIAKSNPVENNHRTLKFIASVARHLTDIPDLSKPEILALLLKVHALLNGLSKEEFCYKASRSLEDNVPDVFVHIVKQGIDLSAFFKNVLLGLLATSINDDVLLRVMDFLVLEGFDFLHRVITALFQQNEASILALDATPLYDYIFSPEFVELIQLSTLEMGLLVAPAFVKYENEFNLLSVNAISGNDCELANLKEAHEDLQTHLQDLKQKTESLSKTEAEIAGQLKDFKAELERAQQERDALNVQADELRAKYAQLTMNENLTNLVNANKDISAENTQLELQIVDLEKKIQTKSAKLKKKAQKA